MKVTAVVLAAGTGQRVGSDIPKQFLPLGDRPMIGHSLAVLESCREVAAVVAVLPPDSGATEPNLEEFGKLVARIAGGTTRQESLAHGLARLPDGTEVVLVHDAARPLLDQRLISDLLAALDGTCDGVIPAIPVEDTLKKVSENLMVEGELDRRNVWRVQTPQLFQREALQDALDQAIGSGLESTDCSQMLTAAGYRVRVVEGDPLNFKVTRAADLWLAEQVLASRAEPE